MLERTDDFMTPGEGAPDEESRTAGEADPEEIRAEIRETRERMGDNLEQLGERLSPGHLKDQVKQGIRDATIGKVENMAQSAADQMDEARQSIGEARRTITDTLRENPIPAAMAGIGLGWLVYNARQQGSPRSSRFSRSYGRRYGYGGTAYDTERMGATGQRYGEPGGIDLTRSGSAEMSENEQGTAGEVAGRAQDMAHNVADQTRRQAKRAGDQFNENPLAMGAAAVALGMAAGLAIPETRKESEFMGDARDRVAGKVREAASATKDKVEKVVDRVADQAQTTAKTSAREEGLSAT
jgi:hypothetical protein